METINILGANRFESHTKVREACRGIVLQDGNLLLSYSTKTDHWLIPGGGLEAGERLEDCCQRELAEETGCMVKPRLHYLTIHEYYEEWMFISHYFLCDMMGKTAQALTAQEVQVGLEPRWMPLQEAISLFSRHQDYAHDEMKRGAYLREYEALKAYLAVTGAK